MATITYLKHTIEVTPGGRSHGETAHVTIDGERHCFLGGETEARRFLRERKLGPHYGPRRASWYVRLQGSICTSTYYTHACALSAVAYHEREGQLCTLVRVESCPFPECDGYGEVSEHGKRGMVTHRPCPQHVAIEEVTEIECPLPGGHSDTPLPLGPGQGCDWPADRTPDTCDLDYL